MSSVELARLGARKAAEGVRAGRVSPIDLVEAYLARIRGLDDRLTVWSFVDADGARATARERQREARAGRLRGPLHGVPIGVKDIFDVAGMPTTGGARPFAHTRPAVDSTAVARLRAAGAIIVGKTVTTEFAYRDPAPTRNPWNTAHTPGGSSAGSAAAIAARMVPLALGSQTVGSVLRPAAYCGVVGFKGTHGLVPVAGVIPLAWSLDHVGVLAPSVTDAALAMSVLAGRSVEPLPVSTPRLALAPALLRRATPVLAAHDALLLPTAPGPAPAGLDSTGDGSLCAPWTSAGVPAISLPSGLAASGLPLAIQLVQAAGGSARLFGTAVWCERVLGFSQAPAV